MWGVDCIVNRIMYGICLRNGLYGFIEEKSLKKWTKKKHSAKDASH